MKKNKGITLIALIITIIVLIILAGITISTLIGDNGIITKAQEGKQNMQNAVSEEQGQLQNVLEWIEGQTVVPEGTVVFGKVVWNNGQAEVTAHASEGVTTLEYQINGTEGNWTSLENGGRITGLQHNDEVCARLDATVSEDKYAKIKIQDTQAPTATILAGEITSSSIEVTVEANDEQSGLAETETYQYYLGEELKEILTENRYSYTGLTAETEYSITVVVTDKAGNKMPATATIATEQEDMRVITKLKEGDYVNYVDGKGITRKCVVLYDATKNYGIQIITMDIVDNVALGNGTGSTNQNTNSTYFNTSRNSYNAAISTLNSKAQEYKDAIYATSARCVGSVPNAIGSESGFYTSSSSYMSSYNGTLRNTDHNYQTDWDQMTDLGIHNLQKDYWLASRYIAVESSWSFYTNFDIRLVNSERKFME